MNELISVVIPVYKVEAYLPDCIESVLAQTWQKFEIILVDDGSPDRSGQICDEYAAQDSRIRVIHKENGGLSTARNAGIDAAKGEYLAFLDSDDLWTPLFLERLYTALTEANADLSVCLFRRFQGESPRELPVSTGTLSLSRREAFECLFDSRNENMVIAPNKLYRRRLFNGVRYPVGRLHEDEAVIHEIIGGVAGAAWLEEAHYLYRVTPDSIMTSRFSLRRLDAAYTMERRITYFEYHGMHGLADRTRIVYLSNLMRLHRMVQELLDDKSAAKDACLKLHARFCELCIPELIQEESAITKVRYALFRRIPRLYSRVEFYRLKHKGVI